MPGFILLFWLCLSPPRKKKNMLISGLQRMCKQQDVGCAMSSIHGRFWQEKLCLVWVLEGVASWGKCVPLQTNLFPFLLSPVWNNDKKNWHWQISLAFSVWCNFPLNFWNQVWKYSKREIIFMHKWGRSANRSWWPQHTSPGMWWYLGWDQSILDTVSSDWVLIPLSQPALPWWSPSLCSFSVILQVFSARYCHGSGMAEQCSQPGKVESALTSTGTPQSCRRQKEDLTLYVSPFSSHTS